MKYLLITFVGALLWLPFSGCKKDAVATDTGKVDPLVKFTSDTFNDLYLWYSTMPTVKLSTIKTPDDYIAKVKNDKDRWSFTMGYQELINLLNNGTSQGWGIGLGYDGQNALRILFVYDNSVMGRAGVKRGWQIKAINGTAVSSMTDAAVNTAIANGSNNFTFIRNDGTETTLALTKGTIGINSVQVATTFNRGSKKIGYLVFTEFLGSSVKELNTAFNYFTTMGITDMVLDLRYNGGGTLDCADSLVALMAGKSYQGKIYNSLIYNDKHVRYNSQSIIGVKSNSIKLNQLVIITTSSTASASELVIAGLKPYLNPKLIGSNTHGKPVGMDIQGSQSLNLAVAPISFRNVNAQGYSDYYSGIPVDFAVKDNITQDWGDPADLCLTAALNYITTGSIGYIPTSKSIIKEQSIVYKGSEFPIENLFKLNR